MVSGTADTRRILFPMDLRGVTVGAVRFILSFASQRLDRVLWQV